MHKLRVLLAVCLLGISCAQAAIDPELLKPLADDDSDRRIAAILALVEAAPEEAQPVYLRNKIALTTQERLAAKP